MRKFYNYSKFLLLLVALSFASSTNAQCDISVSMNSASWGDVTSWELRDGSGTAVLTGGTYGNGYTDVQTTIGSNPPYNLVVQVDNSQYCDNFPNYSVTVGGSPDISGTVDVGCTDTQVTLPLSAGFVGCATVQPPTPLQDPALPTCSAGTALTISGTPATNNVWYWQTSSTGTLTTNPYVGAYSVFVNGTYYARSLNTVTNIWSPSVSVTVSNMPIAIIPPAPTADINPSCVTTGSQLSSVLTGDANITYYWQTVANGTSTADIAATDVATTPLTAPSTGTYYVSAFDASNSCWSPTIGTLVTVDTYIPAAPSASVDNFNLCAGATTLEISATASGGSASTNGSNATSTPIPDNNTTGISSTINISNIPAGSTITGITVGVNITHTWNSDLDIFLTGSNGTQIELSTDNGGSGDNYTNTIFSSAGVNPITGGVSPFTGTFLPEGNLTTLYSLGNGSWTLTVQDDSGGDFGTLLNWNISITYTPPASTISWYDAATAGNGVGTGTPLETVGTSVMASPASNGNYSFYAGSVSGACESATRTLVTVNVLDVNVTLTPIDETCIGYSNGSFTEASVDCGTAPFTYSVDGGAFGPIPTDLMAGTYSVVAQDATLLQSNPISVVIGTTDTFIPEAPTASTAVYDICGGLSDFDITATAPGSVLTTTTAFPSGPLALAIPDNTPAGLTNVIAVSTIPAGATITGLSVTLNIAHTFDGDLDISLMGANGTTIELTTDNGGSGDNYTNTVLSSTGVNPVTGGLAPFTGTFLPEGNLSTLYSLANGNWSLIIGDDAFGDIGTLNDWSLSITYAMPADLNWYDAATAGTLLGTGTPFDCIGNSVLADPSSNGSYEFYAATLDGACESATRTLVTVNVLDVNVALTPINETCTGYANGSFALGAVSCGTAPFTYSLDGGATFGAIPTDLTPGTYSVVAQDATLLQSNPISVVIGTTDTYIPDAPTVTADEFFICSGETSLEIEAASGGTASQSIIIATDYTLGASATGVFNDNLSIPAGSTITSATVTFDNMTSGIAFTDTWLSDCNFTFTGSITNIATFLTGIGANVGPQSYNVTVDPAGGAFTMELTDTYGGNTTFYGSIVLDVTYNLPAATIEWYDAATNGNLEGSGSPFESIGTTVLATPAAEGSYEFFAGSLAGGCYSIDRTLVTVNVNNVNVELASIDATCNGSATGSFDIIDTVCGLTPFVVSVDGGAYGPIPTDLLPGSHTITIQDDNGDFSAAYTLVIGEADAPTDSYMEDITDNSGQVSWNSNGNETEWNVEWGLPGFIPGTGAEIGSTQAMDTFAIITGLDGNTNYDVYISANCGAGTTTGSWDMVNWTTDCGIYTLPFEETFEDNSITRVCWYNINEVGAGDWTYNTGSSGGAVLTAFEGTLNARFVSADPSGGATPISKLASPRFDFAGQDSVALIFAYAQEVWFGDQNITKVYTAGAAAAWTEIASYSTTVNA